MSVILSELFKVDSYQLEILYDDEVHSNKKLIYFPEPQPQCLHKDNVSFQMKHYTSVAFLLFDYLMQNQLKYKGICFSNIISYLGIKQKLYLFTYINMFTYECMRI